MLNLFASSISASLRGPNISGYLQVVHLHARLKSSNLKLEQFRKNTYVYLATVHRVCILPHGAVKKCKNTITHFELGKLSIGSLIE